MASINQVVSEVVHALGQPNNYALRENVRSLVIHTRNELIRHSMENHGYVDSVLQQRFKVSLQQVTDGEIVGSTKYVKRTTQKVPRPVRFTNNLPFLRVSNPGYFDSREIPYIKETTSRFREYLPGMKGIASYDYINDYVYIFPSYNNTENSQDPLYNLSDIIIEAPFEHPTEIDIKSGNGADYDYLNDDNEWLLPEDMIGQIKDIIFKRDLLQNRREDDEINNSIKMQ